MQMKVSQKQYFMKCGA